MEVLATEEGLKKEKDVMDTHTMDLFMSSPPIIQRNRGQNERENIIFFFKKKRKLIIIIIRGLLGPRAKSEEFGSIGSNGVADGLIIGKLFAK